MLNKLLGEDVLSTNVFAVMKRAAEYEDNERYRFLSGYVLPGGDHQSPRLAGAFTATHPAPIGKTTRDGESRVEVGGRLIAPAYELVDTAVRLNRLDELRARVTSYQPKNEQQKRARYALLFLLEAARKADDG